MRSSDGKLASLFSLLGQDPEREGLALTLAHRLLAAGHGNGVYFALPTQATSNAMYTRVGAVYRDFYSRDSQPSLVLAHGARQLRDDFTRSILPEMAPDTPYTLDDEGGLAQCSQWLADSRKKALLADVGVGTVDQALLGVLPRRHQSLRLLGLARKVLVVDEVHAYDTYTGTLLERLLEAHARHGGSAILLSATIPQSMRRRFLEAWQRGREGGQALQPASEAFPLATHLYSEGLDETPVAARTSSERDLPVDFVHSEEEALSRVVEAARSGRCACWIRNTVDDAIGAYQALRESLPEPDKALLFHARFTMGDRQRIENDALRLFGKESGNAERAGRVLIATQVGLARCQRTALRCQLPGRDAATARAGEDHPTSIPAAQAPSARHVSPDAGNRPPAASQYAGQHDAKTDLSYRPGQCGAITVLE
ncbi:CRISPR-associated helicase Cas3' [Halorhodospira halochloris]|uniref:CRISPR-associated helicase Cas3' n=1 Tax=Halorhodospira halochloris TaxID=1052 RepID=UPI003083F081